MVTEPRVASAGQDGLRAARVTEATQHDISSRAAVQSAVRTAVTTLLCPTQPDHQWCTPDQLPPDVQHTADGKTTAVLGALSCLCFRGIFGGCLLSIHSFMLRDDLQESCVAYTTLICRTCCSP